jgi:hypothetical protein
MKFQIKNGLLIAGNERINLPHVSRWKAEQTTIVFMVHGQQITLNMGTETAALDKALLELFTGDTK